MHAHWQRHNSIWLSYLCRAAPQGDRAIEGQKAQPTGIKASNEKGEQPLGPKRGSNVSCALPQYCWPISLPCDGTFLNSKGSARFGDSASNVIADTVPK